jgi:hypothetical protein
MQVHALSRGKLALRNRASGCPQEWRLERHRRRQGGKTAHLETLKGRRRLQVRCRCGQRAHTVVAEIRVGRKLRIRQRTERSILAVTKTAYAGGALIDADPTWKKINTLLDEGFTKSELARRLGSKTPALQFSHFEVTAKTAARVDRFYRAIMLGGDVPLKKAA